MYASSSGFGDISVKFSKGRDADTLIKDMVDKGKNPSSIIVITDDKQLAYDIKQKGAHHKSTHIFLDENTKKRPLPRREGFKIGLKQMNEINQEIKDRWNEKY